ncbi:MAG: ATP-dependent DNA helicase [Acidimicrobiia bacterium]|nr:ATP-dependent DNA helicase [Acidimicrobiia bacterium]
MDDSLAAESVAVLHEVLGAKEGAVARPGQIEMVEAVAAALGDQRHLVVEAGTGTGKSLAYLIPIILSGYRVAISTATKSLQNQLADIELPFLADHLPVPVTWSVVKGRQSYACMAKLVESFGADLDGRATAEMFALPGDGLEGIAAWIREGGSGDRDDLPETVTDEVWRSASVSGMECPGKASCDQGGSCFAELALDRARDAQLTVTNHHLYALHLAADRRILPEHDAVVFDEAHKLEAASSAAFGVDVGAGRLTAFTNNVQRLIPPTQRNELVDAVRHYGGLLDDIIADLPEARLSPAEGELGEVILGALRAVARADRAVPKPDEEDPLRGAVARARNQGGHLQADFGLALDMPEGYVAWVEAGRRVIRVAPVSVATPIAANLLVHHPAILTSATLTTGGSFAAIAGKLGLVSKQPADDPVATDVAEPLERTYRELRVEGSFDYSRQGLLYIAAGLPDPRDGGWQQAAADEAMQLVAAAGGRALVLTTSFRMMQALAGALVDGPFELLVQGELPKRQLIAQFAAAETSVLVATMGYWEGIDVPGPSLSLVVIDRIPFPRPDDPLMQARREAVTARGGSPFDEVDLPHATVMLAQGSGRLIRNETDRGVVAVLDRRLSAMRYGQRILRSLPRLLRTSDRERALRFLAEVAAARSRKGET